MLFDFELRPVDEIQPWGEAPNQSLSWFGLTDGWYRLQVGEERLFNYSHKMTALLLAKYPYMPGSFVDYQVARLWEDILQILPDVLNPIPPELAHWFLVDNLQHLRVSAQRYWNAIEDSNDDSKYDTYGNATEWLLNRHIDSLYLRAGPDVWIWSCGETVTITWDNRGNAIDGVDVWSALSGSYSMPKEAFLEDVKIFNNALISQMEERVESVREGWERSYIQIDFESLSRDQIERTGWLEKRMPFPPNVIELKGVLSAIAAVT